MTTPRIEHVWVTRAAVGVSAPAWVQELQRGTWLQESAALKLDGSSWVRRARLQGVDVVVKCRSLDSLARRVKAMIGQEQFDRHWRAAGLLGAARIPTGEMKLLARAIVDGQPAMLLVLSHVEGPTLLEMMRCDARSEVARPERVLIACSVGALVFRLRDRGLHNRDLKPSNVVMSTSRAGVWNPAIIDLVGVRRARLADRAARMFASLVIEPTGCGVPPAPRLMVIALRAWLDAHLAASSEQQATPQARRAMMRAMWSDVKSIVQTHGDPTPRVAPMTPS
ncbi:MAG: hypothetical protein K2W85_08695 [Phycisphaerales bacterium]|nr:hypothetical protein [Phycisphaerales bacterium]